ncbi:DUF2637 domain-containing protein [Paenarthrobacter sp. NPDC056912]|uniref:DUF2637 domain-containing protein n=1 Tax=Paenarthrobacter sp. NPDC056912 TaxID=3345965 RepID=UPI00366D4163
MSVNWTPLARAIRRTAESEVRTLKSNSSSAATRINPDSLRALWFTVTLVCFLAAASFMVSFAALHEVAAWVGLPVWMRWTVPVFIDVAILAYSLAVLIHRSRGEPTWASWVSLGGFTFVSVVANAAHAMSVGSFGLWQTVIGACVAGLAPLAVFAATEELGRLAVARNVIREETIAAPEFVDAPTANKLLAVAEEESHLEEESGAAEPASVSEPLPTAKPSSTDEIDVREWALSQRQEGLQISGSALAEVSGWSPSTARRRLSTLRRQEPAIFETEPTPEEVSV